MICNADEYAESGRHHHIACLNPGQSFEGVYLVTTPPTSEIIEGEQRLVFTVSDFTGNITCSVDPLRAGWAPGADFSSQRLLLRGSVVIFKNDRLARLSDLQPVFMKW